ncbi:hypothetical protein [Microcoleus sp. CAWBG58]|nr:hypothetical protein [Microcoleus sp. CAWBG58]
MLKLSAIDLNIIAELIYETRQKPGFWQNPRRSLKSPKNPVSLSAIALDR